MMQFRDDDREWLEADGLGGFASGTVSGVRTRRYHALLLAATTPPTGRVALVNGFDAWVDVGGERHAISSQRYAPDVIAPDGANRITGFTREPWPTWRFSLPDGGEVVQEIFVPHGQPAVAVSWRLEGISGPATLVVRPFLSGRDYHATHHENSACDSGTTGEAIAVRWQPYSSVPSILSLSNGRFSADPVWYRNFLYAEESARGLDDREDLLSPGTLTFDLSGGEALWLLRADNAREHDVAGAVARLRLAERSRRSAFPTALDRSADAYLVRRGDGRTIIAGYPWFTDWGRDTFIALRGLFLATGRFDEALEILLQWADTVSLGMLPNRFADAGDEPEFNAVDASLWFVVAVRDLLEAAAAGRTAIAAHQRPRLLAAVTAILEGYQAGTRYGIRLDADGLLACGEPGVQLTWMDAKVGTRVVTPRIGKPVEVQALWLHALAFASAWDARWQVAYVRGRINFARKFWNPASQSLYDVVDVDHEPGLVDASCRPNQIFALGGLGDSLVDAGRTKVALAALERKLLTPLGLRSLAADEPGYAPAYRGGPVERDAAYHQGTAWPWLLGPFIEAWLAARGRTDAAKAEAYERFLAPLDAHLEEAGLGHVSEIADADAPFTPRGCPFQAWSLGELLRVRALLCARSDTELASLTLRAS